MQILFICFFIALTLLAGQAYADDVALECQVNVLWRASGLPETSHKDVIRLDVFESAKDVLSISGIGVNTEFSIDNKKRSSTIVVDNRSETNIWRLSRSDTRGNAVSKKSISLDRNTGTLTYAASVENMRDGLVTESSIAGSCRKIDSSRKLF